MTQRRRSEEIISKFKSENIVVLATKAFGMGIDISDIEIVYHHDTWKFLIIPRIDERAGIEKLEEKPILYLIKRFSILRILKGISLLTQWELNYS